MRDRCGRNGHVHRRWEAEDPKEYKKTVGDRRPRTARLSALYNSMGGYAKVKPLCRQELEIDRMALRGAAPAHGDEPRSEGIRPVPWRAWPSAD